MLTGLSQPLPPFFPDPIARPLSGQAEVYTPDEIYIDDRTAEASCDESGAIPLKLSGGEWRVAAPICAS